MIIDLDPQGNASTGLGIDRRDRAVSSYDVLTGALELEEAALPTAVPGLSIVPSTLDLLGIEMEIAGAPDRVLRLRNAVRASSSRAAGYSYILIDCPPSLNLLTLNSMAAADSGACAAAVRIFRAGRPQPASWKLSSRFETRSILT